MIVEPPAPISTSAESVSVAVLPGDRMPTYQSPVAPLYVPWLGFAVISVTPAVPLDRDAIRRYEDLGVSRLVPILRGRSADDQLRFVDSTAALL